jgi:ATP synthase subunit 6
MASFLIIGVLSFVFVAYFTSSKKGGFFLRPGRVQRIFEMSYSLVYGLIQDNAGDKGKAFFPYVFTLFTFVLLLNVVGLVPYSFTVTSHIIVTLSLALITFMGINIVCACRHGRNMLSLFLPAGSSLAMALLLVPIEIVSYIFRPISLSVRLFANMMAGHTLLKVIVGFAWAMCLAGNSILLLGHVFPLTVLIILMFIEMSVAAAQSYVFTTLVCVCLKNGLYAC